MEFQQEKTNIVQNLKYEQVVSMFKEAGRGILL